MADRPMQSNGVFGRFSDEFIGHCPLFRMLGTSLDQVIAQRPESTVEPNLAALCVPAFECGCTLEMLIPVTEWTESNLSFLPHTAGK